MKRVVQFAATDFGGIYQRPQALTTAFAELGYRSVYVSGCPVYRLNRAFRKVDHAAGVELATMWTATSPHLWARLGLLERLDMSIHRLQARRFFAPDTLTLISSPSWAHLFSGAHLNWAGPVVYDCYDDWGKLAPDFSQDLDELEARLVRKVTLASVSTPALADKLRALRGDLPIILLPNAVEFSRFRQAAGAGVEVRKRLGISGPVVGFLGAIYDWVDEPLLFDLAGRLPQVTILLCGPVAGFDDSRLKKLPNVIFTGMVPYDQVPAHIDAFDVAIVPFRVIDRMQSVNSNKFYQYLSLGKPIVTVDIPSVHEFGGLMRIARDRDEFCSLVAGSLEAPATTDQAVAERVQYAGRNSWTQRANRILEALNQR